MRWNNNHAMPSLPIPGCPLTTTPLEGYSDAYDSMNFTAVTYSWRKSIFPSGRSDTVWSMLTIVCSSTMGSGDCGDTSTGGCADKVRIVFVLTISPHHASRSSCASPFASKIQFPCSPRLGILFSFVILQSDSSSGKRRWADI